MERFGFFIEGLVQGVGFRPFVYSLAKKYKLSGFIRNTPQGVYMEIEGYLQYLNKFLVDFNSNLPALARVDKLEQIYLDLKHDSGFLIEKSEQKGIKHSAVLPDMAVCKDCLREMMDPTNRRYFYPFINCTNCGPRYSIVNKLPYDRPNTSMFKFPLCSKCATEYKNPEDRRYHAQPISCPDCGPRLSLYATKDGTCIAKEHDAILKLVKKIQNGEIVAVKGMGGFHLVCDALNLHTVSTLRKRKKRPTKPFAIMCKDIEMAKEFAILTDPEERMLQDITKPIVLVSKKMNQSLPNEIAPNTHRLGMFLPYTPLHVLLLKLLDRPIVATSANRAGEPIIYKSEILLTKLKNVVDYFLDFDRDIVNPSDDSIVLMIDDKPLYLRLSRGVAPSVFPLKKRYNKTILAVGAEQKNSIAILHEGKIIQSPYIGDMNSVEGFEFFTQTLQALQGFYDLKPDLIFCDKHPGYTTSRWAKEQNLPIHEVQHHHAHICGTMLEHNLNGPVLGISWDGTGYGEDGTIWGGEFLVCENGEFDRVASFESFSLLGGEVSIKEIWRIAYSILRDELSNKVDDLKIFDNYKSMLPLLSKAYEKGINAPTCSSVGRIFDAVAFLATGLKSVSYDGEGGLLVESLYDSTFDGSYKFFFKNGIIYYKENFIQMLKDEPKILVTKFLNGLVDSIILQAKLHEMPLVVSGGVFQNKTLLKRLLCKAKENSISIYFPQKTSPNDSGIAFGQLAQYVLAQ